VNPAALAGIKRLWHRLATFALGMSTCLAAAESLPTACPARPRPHLAVLDRMHAAEEFRIFYTLDGEHALPRLQDLNANGVPDMVEDAARQLVAARRLYTEVLALVHPLQQPRYRLRAQAVAVNLLRLPRASAGLAYDEPRRDLRPGLGSEGLCVLRIDLDTRWAPPSQTPAHELFHLYQYGYTMFKLRWFLEGMARWAESALGSRRGRDDALPDSPAALGALLASSYRAGGFWNRLARLDDPDGVLQVPPPLQALRYSDGTPVLEDAHLHGGALMKAVLEALARADRRVSQREGWPPFGWKESDQKSRAHDADAWAAVREAVAARQIGTAEVARLLALPTP